MQRRIAKETDGFFHCSNLWDYNPWGEHSIPLKLINNAIESIYNRCGAVLCIQETALKLYFCHLPNCCPKPCFQNSILRVKEWKLYCIFLHPISLIAYLYRCYSLFYTYALLPYTVFLTFFPSPPPPFFLAVKWEFCKIIN